MVALEFAQTQSLQTRQELRQFLRLEQASLLEMPEEDFHRLISEIENSPFFKKLYQQEKIIRYQRFPGTDISSGFYQLKEELVADRGSLDVESLLLNKEQVVRQIQRLGVEKFKRFFLYPDPEMGQEDIARECGLEVWEVQKINSLVDELSIMSEFYHPSAHSFGDGGIRYSKVASIERGTEGFVIGYFSPSFARGRYSINYERFEELKRAGTFSETEAKDAKQLFRKLELINTRKDTVTLILQSVVEKQALYLKSGNLRALLPFSQKELAKKIGLVPSSISRAIAGKSIDTPWGEKPLKDFFPRPRRFKKELIRQLLESETEPLSDEAIKGMLDKDFGISISRRSVASLRKELKFPPSWKRKRASIQQRKL